MSPSPERGSFQILFGVVLPPLCWMLDPFFFPSGSFVSEFRDWAFFRLGRPYSVEALTAYALAALPASGLLAHLAAPGRLAFLARPALLFGILWAAFFAFALLPTVPWVPFLLLAVIPGVLVLAPYGALWAYFSAYRESLDGRGARGVVRDIALAAVLVCLGAAPLLHFRLALAGLRGASRPHQIARALDRLAPYGKLADHDLRQVYLDSDPVRRLWLANLWLEATGEQLLDRIAAHASR